MKRIYLNLKRFDIPKESGGVNSIFPVREWGSGIVRHVQKPLQAYPANEAAFTVFFPEAHIISAVKAQYKNSPVRIGCQGVYRDDTAIGGNFGAFTTNRTANAAKAIGCTDTIIGHVEERRDKMGILQEGGVSDLRVVNRILNQEIRSAMKAGLSVLYCIGETADEQRNWQEVLMQQLVIGLDGIPMNQVAIAYEPVWAIGPGKTPPDRDYVQKIARFIKQISNGAPVVYGGGLKVENAAMLASIPELDGGLIALTRFSGEIGFYPEEYLEIIRTYMGK